MPNKLPKWAFDSGRFPGRQHGPNHAALGSIRAAFVRAGGQPAYLDGMDAMLTEPPEALTICHVRYGLADAWLVGPGRGTAYPAGTSAFPEPVIAGEWRMVLGACTSDRLRGDRSTGFAGDFR